MHNFVNDQFYNKIKMHIFALFRNYFKSVNLDGKYLYRVMYLRSELVKMLMTLHIDICQVVSPAVGLDRFETETILSYNRMILTLDL